MRFEKVYVIFDGQCGFCIKSLSLYKMLDFFHAFELIDANLKDVVSSRFPSVPLDDTQKAMYVVTQNGNMYRGFFAFRRMTLSSPLLWPLLIILYCPFFSRIGVPLYALIAKNRKRFGCESEVCTLSFDSKSKDDDKPLKHPQND